jgi:chromosome segregation and condensation protein ScpB
MDPASESDPQEELEHQQLTLEAIERGYVRMKEENEFIKDKLVKLEASTALSQDNLETMLVQLPILQPF